MRTSNEIIANIVGKSATNYISLQKQTNELRIFALQSSDFQRNNFSAFFYRVLLSPFPHSLMATLIPPAHLMGPENRISVKRGVSRRFHNRRINMVVTPEGDYQMHFAKAPAPGEAAELRASGHRDTMKAYILRDRVRYTFTTLSAEAFEAAISCYEQLRAKQQRKRARG